MKIKKINTVIGITLLVGFLISGMYMALVSRKVHNSELNVRMEIRANHIYLLFTALLNLLLSRATKLNTHYVKVYWPQTVCGLLLAVAGLLSVLAFLMENNGNLQQRWFSFFSVLCSLIGVLLFYYFAGKPGKIGK